MRRDTISFEDFKDVYIAQPDGFFPVYSSFDEDDYSNSLRVIKIDMICEWRLPDGKLRFLEVPFETEEQFNEIVAYLKHAAGLLNAEILRRIDDLKFSDTRAEPQEEDDDEEGEDEDE